MRAKNSVISGHHCGSKVVNHGVMLSIAKTTFTINLSKRMVDNYVVVSQSTSKSTSSVVKRGIIGGALLGSVGVLAGGLSAKDEGVNKVAINFKDGKKSVIEIDNDMLAVLVSSLS